jgi:SAM-dependent methyltransferase
MTSASTAFTADDFVESYPPGIERHYWYRARNRIVARKLRAVLRPGSRVLDVGCGPGITVDHLRRAGIDCAGVEPGRPRPINDAVVPFLVGGVSPFDLPPAPRGSYSLLLLLDVLEHLPAPGDFLRDCLRAFANAAHVFVTLPARMEIWSSYDEHDHHYRRYTLPSLAELAEGAGLRVVDSGYFFHALYAAARVAGLVTRRRSHRFATPRPVFAHAALGWSLALEETIVPGAIPGSSLYALLERRHAPT